MSPSSKPPSSSVRGHWVRVIWATCLALGTLSHVASFLQSGGFYPGYPLLTVLFWNALTILDPLAATFLLVRPRVGVVATLAIMIADVAHNVWAVATHGAMLRPVILQAAFLVLILATVRVAWPDRGVTSPPEHISVP